MLGLCVLLHVCGCLVLLCNTAKNAKDMINRFYRSELKNRCSFVVYCLTAAERFDQGNTSCNTLHKVCD